MRFPEVARHVAARMMLMAMVVLPGLPADAADRPAGQSAHSSSFEGAALSSRELEALLEKSGATAVEGIQGEFFSYPGGGYFEIFRSRMHAARNLCLSVRSGIRLTCTDGADISKCLSTLSKDGRDFSRSTGAILESGQSCEGAIGEGFSSTARSIDELQKNIDAMRASIRLAKDRLLIDLAIDEAGPDLIKDARISTLVETDVQLKSEDNRLVALFELPAGKPVSFDVSLNDPSDVQVGTPIE